MANVVLWKWQYEVAELVSTLYGSGATVVVKSSRQRGKSVMIATLLCKACLDIKGSKSAFVSVDQRACRELQKTIYGMFGKWIESKQPSNQVLDVVFKNGSRILFFSAEARPKNFRGYAVSGILCMDEDAYVSTEIHNVVLPWTNVKRPPIILASTPSMKTGFFYQEYLSALNGTPNYYLFDWSDKKYNDRGYTNGTIMDDVFTPEQMEATRRRMNPISFRQDYLAEFTDLHSSVFGEFKHLVKQPSSDRRLFIGIDPGNGQGNDYTAIVALNDDCEEVLVEHFNEGGAQDQIDFCIHVIDSLIEEGYEIAEVLCEYNNPRVTYEQLCLYYEPKGVPVYDITVNGAESNKNSKVSLINDIQLAFSNSTLSLLDCNWHLEELADYEMHPTRADSTRATFDGAHLHDDSVMALAHAYRAYKDNHDFYF